MARKTINVEAIKDWANDQLLESERTMEGASMYDEIGRGYRQGVMTMLENVLMSTGNYKGFRYLSIDEVPRGHLPGIKRNYRDEPVFYESDDTRVRYF